MEFQIITRQNVWKRTLQSVSNSDNITLSPNLLSNGVNETVATITTSKTLSVTTTINLNHERAAGSPPIGKT
eukprot:5814741-Karenia_brevis.AAC.1